MNKRVELWVLCAALALVGCGGGRDVATPPAKSAAPEVAVFEMQPAKEESAQAGQPAPAAATGGVSFTRVDEGAQVDDSGASIVISGGCVEVLVDTCALSRDIEALEGASVRLILKNGAAFTGTVRASAMQDVAVILDAASTWTLTSDVSVGVIQNADATFANVQSGGYSITYDAEAADNAGLSGAAKQLPGGGFLTPVI